VVVVSEGGGFDKVVPVADSAVWSMSIIMEDDAVVTAGGDDNDDGGISAVIFIVVVDVVADIVVACGSGLIFIDGIDGALLLLTLLVFVVPTFHC